MDGPGMNELRRNPLTDRWVTIAGGRASRPNDFVTRVLEVERIHDRPCPFCLGNEDATPPALLTYGRPDAWSVRVVPNLYPAFSGCVPMEISRTGPLHEAAPASGLHEVLILGPEHDYQLTDLDDDRIDLVMTALSERISAHSRVGEIAYTQAIVNYGREAGASLDHPHAQLLGIPFVPGEILGEREGFARHQTCLLCDAIEFELGAAERVVDSGHGAIALCPYWSGVPYEMLVMPRRHEENMDAAVNGDIRAVGVAVRDALARLKLLLGDIAYNVVVHTSPHRTSGTFHWHVHILPRTATVAGFEQGTGVMINTMPPEVAAAQLRAASAAVPDAPMARGAATRG